ncbi:ketopantoate hydroxymethyltransferase [Coriobacterium glomerans PW2]|uniref:3-methyl-2-oxobutanoate hydroxymethyltransferase n=1 Tax=Coriobacterium glomerans (strain ATCC 49209 / DSM 20642 / JCM 10262 / PW2) TaxID=700015 RepID=F2N7R6_CORGP|nr:3-methyl-2-oxobutanoate hydroxymethyltransferase [Coriobacterium glomerans]AEB06958.1 ketopantoate hydroxymethyltransferase [Coriobacterium glomerans PW2]
MKTTVTTFQQAKDEGRKLAMLTAYDYSTARLMDASGIDAILVGDSLGMTMLGYGDTLSVTMEDMVHHTRAVSRGVSDALVVGDMPYLSYHLSVEQAVENAGRLIKEGGAQAIKLEGGARFAAEIRAIVRASIPVMGHLGLTPQSVNAFGGFKVQGRSEAAAQQILDDARELERAGVFAIVLECIPAALAEVVSKSLSIPTIGIGSGPLCDGQILVYQDMLGMYSDLAPKFVRRFAEVGALMTEGFKAYQAAVRDSSFPAAEHEFKIDDSVIERLR